MFVCVCVMTAEKAMKALNYTSLNGKMIRVTYSTRDSAARKSGVGNLFVKVFFFFTFFTSLPLALCSVWCDA